MKIKICNRVNCDFFYNHVNRYNNAALVIMLDKAVLDNNKTWKMIRLFCHLINAISTGYSKE